MPPKVSVIIPTYNRRELVQEAIDSVLAQTYTDYEIIVVDDGSTDGTREALQERYGDRIRYVWQENQGESAARNRGIEMARGEYIAFLDSDDVWLPEKLSKQVNLLDYSPEVGLVCCYEHKVNESGKPLPGLEKDCQNITFQNLCLRNLVGSTSTVVIRKQILTQVGEFDDSIRYGEDWDLWLRVVLVSRIKCITEPLVRVRLHQGGQWWFLKPETINQELKEHLRFLRRAIDELPEKSAETSTLRDEALAEEHARAAWAFYAFGKVEEACEQLEFAINLNPQKWKDLEKVSQSIVGAILRLSRMHPDDSGLPHRYIDTVLSHLPEALAKLRQRRRELVASAEMEIGYNFYACGNRAQARQHILRGLLTDPRWLSNRGAVATLLELYVGKEFVSALRRFRPGSKRKKLLNA